MTERIASATERRVKATERTASATDRKAEAIIKNTKRETIDPNFLITGRPQEALCSARQRQMFICAKAKRQRQMFSVAKAKRQLQCFICAKAKRQQQQMFYLRESEATATKRPVVTEINHTLCSKPLTCRNARHKTKLKVFASGISLTKYCFP
ncbi:hypothetical protein FJQ98_01305 [Lysinibacillus agricola]|uniref:Uncharacterized protein n=1 Tax=Lysinibacillus agricola TaxID=2590012 RepID=A0ABX7AS35_9BACI|nr:MULTISPECIES: hypothetical protein [Lysinibacillus]KOS60514.1 hypothetical protein AN161_22700 [Lysinibacillus sp. FJAT-14222]QQP12763.1 hypothetical protein FJQ98_01305 [Lysinibacillus agricola]